MAEEKNIVDQMEETIEKQETEIVDELNPSTDDQQQVNNEETPVSEVEMLKQQLGELENRNLRLQADFDNYRRRVRLDQEAATKFRAQSLLTDILPVLDNFERALSAANVEDEKAKSLLQGLEMVYRSLVEAVKKEGLEAIESVGKPFDPNIHQAVMQEPSADVESNTVLEEFQKGYMLKERVIRPSMVKVSE